jgi:hypothetical protein
MCALPGRIRPARLLGSFHTSCTESTGLITCAVTTPYSLRRYPCSRSKGRILTGGRTYGQFTPGDKADILADRVGAPPSFQEKSSLGEGCRSCATDLGGGVPIQGGP